MSTAEILQNFIWSLYANLWLSRRHFTELALSCHCITSMNVHQWSLNYCMCLVKICQLRGHYLLAVLIPCRSQLVTLVKLFFFFYRLQACPFLCPVEERGKESRLRALLMCKRRIGYANITQILFCWMTAIASISNTSVTSMCSFFNVNPFLGNF